MKSKRFATKRLWMLLLVSALMLSCSKDDGGGFESYTPRIKSNSLAQMKLEGNVESMRQTAAGATTVYRFDERGMVTSLGPDKMYFYDAEGRLSRFVNNSAENPKTVTITYGGHDKYIYVDQLRSEEEALSPYLNGVVSVVAAYPAYTISAAYSVSGDSGTIGFTRTEGPGSYDYGGTMTFDGRMPGLFQYDFPDYSYEKYYFFYGPSSGNIIRFVYDRGGITNTVTYYDNSYNRVNKDENINGPVNVETSFLHTYDQTGDMLSRTTLSISSNNYNTYTDNYRYSSYDYNGNWTTRSNGSTVVTRNFTYYP